MRRTYIVLLAGMLAATCALASYVRIRLQIDEDGLTVVMLQDRETSREKVEEIMGKLAALDASQFILVQITKDVPAADFLSVMSMLRTKRLTNVSVSPPDGTLVGETTNRLSFTLMLPDVTTLEEFEGPLELLEDVPEIQMPAAPTPSPQDVVAISVLTGPWLILFQTNGGANAQYGSNPGDSGYVEEGTVDFSALLEQIRRSRTNVAEKNRKRFQIAIRRKDERTTTAFTLIDDSCIEEILKELDTQWKPHPVGDRFDELRANNPIVPKKEKTSEPER